MPVSINALKPGDVVYDVHMQKMGNTTMRRLGVWSVVIKEVDVDAGKVLASWNGNTPSIFRARGGRFAWRRTDPTRKPAPAQQPVRDGLSHGDSRRHR